MHATRRLLPCAQLIEEGGSALLVEEGGSALLIEEGGSALLIEEGGSADERPAVKLSIQTPKP